jgi:hypothetical protein
MESRNTNKIGIQCICWFYPQGICHDARSYDLKVGKTIQDFFFFLNIASHKRPLSLRPSWFRVEYQKSNDEPVVRVTSVTRQTNWLGMEADQMLRRHILA